MIKSSLLAACSLLVLAILASVFAFVGHLKEPALWTPLATRMPLNLDDWVGQDVPLGADESVLEAVGRLNYEDYVYRVYRRGSQEVYVYAMFWRQGDISVREMSGHTPDGCWVANGAKHARTPHRATMQVDSEHTTREAEIRAFEFPSNSTLVEVAWWHIWGRKLIDRSYADKTLIPMLNEIWVWLAERKGGFSDQLLVRIHSQLPIEEAIQTLPAVRFLETIPEVLSTTSNS
jgi:hypothetical protein